jgi:hypothetical protein
MNGIGNKIFEFIFNQLIKQDFIAGHRMYIGGSVAILGGIGLIGEMLVNQKYDDTKMAMAWAGIALGYKTIGEAGKQDARTAALLVAATKQEAATSDKEVRRER